MDVSKWKTPKNSWKTPKSPTVQSTTNFHEHHLPLHEHALSRHLAKDQGLKAVNHNHLSKHRTPKFKLQSFGWYCWWQPEIRRENQLRLVDLVLYPIIYKVLAPSQVVSRISEPSTACHSEYCKRNLTSLDLINTRRVERDIYLFFEKAEHDNGKLLVYYVVLKT